jgi:hypothetical protein
MPGLPSTSSTIESPTGCTKQLISVAASGGAGGGVDAASRDEAVFLRPQETWLPSGARSSLLRWRRVRLGDARRTSCTLVSEPLAYFSMSTSVEISCSGSGPGLLRLRSGRVVGRSDGFLFLVAVLIVLNAARVRVFPKS